MRASFFILIAVFVMKFEADAIEIDCRFTTDYMSPHGYACEVKTIKLASDDDRELTKVTGTHESGYSNDNVGLYYQHVQSELKFFPQNIKNYFKNVHNVYIRYAKITAITKEDLKPFGAQLERIDFYNNAIEVIEQDLFDYTKNLKEIYFDNNKIKHVGSDVFKHLQKLTTLHFTSNPCHYGYARDRNAVINLIATIENKCKDQQALERYRNMFTTTTEAPTTTTTEKNCAEELRVEIAKLNEEHNQKIDEEAAKFKVEIDNLKAENAKLLLEVEVKNQSNDKNNEIIKKLIELDSKFDKSEANMKAEFQKSEVKIDSVIKSVETSKDTALKDLILENFTSLNATCSAFDYKLDLLNRDCFSRPCYRQP